MTPEGKIKKKFSAGLKELKERYGKLMIRMPVSRGMGKPLLDYLLCANGHFVLVEAKRDIYHELTPQQNATQKEAFDAGAYAWVVYDDRSIEQVLGAIKALLCQQ
jgi:hypothetical protein